MAGEIVGKSMSSYDDADSIVDSGDRAYYKANAKITTFGKTDSTDTEYSNYNMSMGDVAEAIADGTSITVSGGKLGIGSVGTDIVAKTATVSSTTASVTLDNGKYNVITELPASVETLSITVVSATPKLQECGFEFTLATGTSLATVSATMGGNTLPIIAPSTYSAGKVYQGTSVNGRVTIVEFSA